MRPTLVVGLVCLLALIAAPTPRAGDSAPAAQGVASVPWLVGTRQFDDLASGRLLPLAQALWHSLPL